MNTKNLYAIQNTVTGKFYHKKGPRAFDENFALFGEESSAYEAMRDISFIKGENKRRPGTWKVVDIICAEGNSAPDIAETPKVNNIRKAVDNFIDNEVDYNVTFIPSDIAEYIEEEFPEIAAPSDGTITRYLRARRSNKHDVISVGPKRNYTYQKINWL